MDNPPHIIQVDGIDYPVRFQGFHFPLELLDPQGQTVRLAPWTYEAHMGALRLSLRPDSRGLQMDTDCFCRAVLAHSGLSEERAVDLNGLILWWANGGGYGSVKLDPEGWLDLGRVRIRLQAWTNAERIRALAASLLREQSGDSFDIVNYIDSMVRASIKTIDPPIRVEELDSSSAANLLAAVMDLNLPEELLPEFENAADPEMARKQADRVLDLCARLGWTPSQIWALPAVELDRLLMLMNLTRSDSPITPMRASGLVAHPDAVVIRFEED